MYTISSWNMILISNDFWHNRKMYNFDPYNALLSIATNIPVLLMTALCSRVTYCVSFYFHVTISREKVCECTAFESRGVCRSLGSTGRWTVRRVSRSIISRSGLRTATLTWCSADSACRWSFTPASGAALTHTSTACVRTSRSRSNTGQTSRRQLIS